MPPHTDQILSAADELWEPSHDMEELLQRLRNNGLNKLDSIKIVRETCSLPLGAAKEIIHSSAVWSDTLSDTIETHRTISSASNIDNSQ